MSPSLLRRPVRCPSCKAPSAKPSVRTLSTVVDGLSITYTGVPALACASCGGAFPTPSTDKFVEASAQFAAAAVTTARDAAARRPGPAAGWDDIVGVRISLQAGVAGASDGTEQDPWTEVQVAGTARAIPYDPGARVSDLLVGPETRAQLTDFAYRIEHQKALREQAGPNLKHRFDTAVLTLFGPTGSGKTLAVRKLAGELGLPVLMLNYANLVSKWKGDTGKNISLVFAAAASRPCILFMDEADGLFGARLDGDTEAAQSSNQDKNTLIMLLNEFRGTLINATNRKPSYDAAFDRRMESIEIPAPDATQRLRLWRHVLGDFASLQDDLDTLLVQLEAEALRWNAAPGATDRPFVGADMESVADKALVAAHRRGEPVGADEVLVSMQRYVNCHLASAHGASKTSPMAVQREVSRFLQTELRSVEERAKYGLRELEDSATSFVGHRPEIVAVVTAQRELAQRPLEAIRSRSAVIRRAIERSDMIEYPTLDRFEEMADAIVQASGRAADGTAAAVRRLRVV